MDVAGKALKTLCARATVAAFVLGGLIAVGARQAGSYDVAGPVFGGSATLVALMLPAAALANIFLEGRILDYLDRLTPRVIDANDPKAEFRVDKDTAKIIATHFETIKKAIDPLLRGFVFLLVGFALSIGALFRSTAHLWGDGPNWIHLRVEDLLAGMSLGFDVVGVLLMFPLAWQLLDRDLANKLSTLLNDLANKTP